MTLFKKLTVLIVIFLSAVAANAAVVTIYPSDDTYGDYAAPTINYGTSAVMSVAYVSAVEKNNAFIKFNSADLPTGIINSATLYVNCGISMGNPILDLQECAADWNELILNHSNMPGVAGATASLILNDAVTGYYTIDIIGIVNNWISGNNYGLRITMDMFLQAVLYSREAGAGYEPYLVINYSAFGTPTITPTITETSTPTLFITNTPTFTMTNTPVNSPTFTITLTPTEIPTIAYAPFPFFDGFETGSIPRPYWE